MRYADSVCKYREEYTPEHVYVFTGPCIMSGKTVEVRVPAAGLYKYRQGAKIQEAFSTMSVADREFLMSGISGEAFDEAFDDEDESSQYNYEQVVRESGEITITVERETGWISYYRTNDPEKEETSFQADADGWCELCHDLGLEALVQKLDQE